MLASNFWSESISASILCVRETQWPSQNNVCAGLSVSSLLTNEISTKSCVVAHMSLSENIFFLYFVAAIPDYVFIVY